MNENLMEHLLLSEQQLVFPCFENHMALELSKILLQRIREEELSIAFDISRLNQQVFYYAGSGISPDKEDWIRRKRNIVLRFGHSSYYIAEKNRYDEQVFFLKYGLLARDYTLTAGAFPIIIKNYGLAGVFTITGLKPLEDHQLVVDTMSEYLQQKK